MRVTQNYLKFEDDEYKMTSLTNKWASLTRQGG